MAFFIIIAYLAFRLVLPFFNGIVIGAIVAYLVYPIYARLQAKIKRNTLAAGIMTVAVLLLIFIPLGYGVVATGEEMLELYSKVSIDGLATVVDGYIDNEYVSYISEYVGNIETFFLETAFNLVKSVPYILLNILMAVFVLFFSLRDGKSLISKAKDFIPVSTSNKDWIVKKLKSTVDSVLYVSVFIAVLQGILATIIFAVFGVSAPIFWGFIVVVASILPIIGAMTVWLPLTLYLFLTGNTFAAVGIALCSLILISLPMDYYLKPKLIAKKGKLHPLIALIGLIGGIPLFGVAGIIIGPFVLSLFIFLFETIVGGKR